MKFRVINNSQNMLWVPREDTRHFSLVCRVNACLPRQSYGFIINFKNKRGETFLSRACSEFQGIDIGRRPNDEGAQIGCIMLAFKCHGKIFSVEVSCTSMERIERVEPKQALDSLKATDNWILLDLIDKRFLSGKAVQEITHDACFAMHSDEKGGQYDPLSVHLEGSRNA